MSTAPIPNFALASFTKESSFSYSELLSDGDDVVSRIGTTSLKLTRGTIGVFAPATGIVTNTVGPYNCVVAENCDGTVAPVACLVYVSGKMKADALIWPAGQAHAITADQLRDYGILVESVLYVDGTVVKSAATPAEEAEAKRRIEYNRKHAGQPPEGEKPDLTGAATDSAWGYLTEEERRLHPELGDPIPLSASDKDKEEVTGKPHEANKTAVPPRHMPPDDKAGKK